MQILLHAVSPTTYPRKNFVLCCATTLCRATTLGELSPELSSLLEDGGL